MRNGLLAGEGCSRFFADNSLDRILALDVAWQRPADRRQRRNVGAMRQRLEPRVFEHGLKRRNMTGARPVVIMRGHEAEEPRNRLALLRAALARRNDPAVAADEFDMASPQPRIRENGIALVQRPTGSFGLLLERADHPCARRIDASLAADECRDRA